MAYRSDIDGLRAVAVLLVVLFHCGYERYLPGGYVGVDVFFVISGYLITKIIYEDAELGKLDLWGFYERRIRRIFPALFAMYAFVLAASFLLLMPSEVATQAKSILASILFSSNAYFYHAFDYFDASSEFNAVLHTWSLSVEEQFYIFFPPLLFVLVAKYRSIGGLVLLGLAAFSLAVAQLRLSADPSAVFYMVWYRAWELLIGSLIAIGLFPKVRNIIVGSIAAATGLMLIAGSAVFLTRSSPFPGLAALPSCIGAGLIIWGGQLRPNIVGLALGIAPMRFVGRISYSLYLWHWPIWILGQYVFEARSLADRVAYLAMMFAVAFLSWRFVEQPFRRARGGTAPKRVVSYGVVGLAATATITVVTPHIASMVWQVSPRVEAVAQFIHYRPEQDQRIGECFLTNGIASFLQFDKASCLATDPAKPDILLFGDSHAAQYLPGLKQFGDLNILQANASGCRPVPDPVGPARCTDMMRYITNDFIPSRGVDTVIVAARWQDSDTAAISEVVRSLAEDVERVIVMGPIVEYERALPRLLAESLYENDPQMVKDQRVEGRAELDDRMEKAVEAAGGEYISIIDTMCPDDQCDVWTSDGNPIQADYGHLTAAGSRKVLSRLEAVIRNEDAAPTLR